MPLGATKMDAAGGATGDGSGAPAPDGDKENAGRADPRRTPLPSRLPFASAPASAPIGGGGGAASSSRRTRREVTPAYAYKNAATGLLEIRTRAPPPLSLVGHEDDTVAGLEPDDDEDESEEGGGRATRLALYPIALNGGGAGLYRDPREFARGDGGGGGFGANRSGTVARKRRAPLRSHVRFAWPCEVKGFAPPSPTRDLEAGLGSNSGDDDRTARTRRSLGTLASAAAHPWRVWEAVHGEMARRAALRARRAEDEASHVTLARQRNRAAGVSQVYNDDDYDFALVLAPHDAYAFWAAHLDFREEALHLVDDQGPTVEELGEGEGEGPDPDDDSTIATREGAPTKEKEASADRAAPSADIPMRTPGSSGLRRRRTPTNSDARPRSNTPLRFSSAARATPSSNSRSPYRAARQSSARVFSQRKSLFERALDRFSPTGPSQRDLSPNNARDDGRGGGEGARGAHTPSNGGGNERSTAASPHLPSSAPRRRWGNAYDGNQLSTPNLTSPPIRSLKRGSSLRRKRGKGSNTFQWMAGHGGGKRASRGTESGGRRGRNSGAKRAREDEDADDGREGDGEDTFLASPGVPRGIGKLCLQ